MWLPMSRQIKLVNKIKHLLKKASAPTYLHHFGPKTYELWQHVFALFVKTYGQLSYRRTTYFLRELGFDIATKSTLQRYAAKLHLPFWQIVLRKTVGRTTSIGVIDGTGLERSRASHYYIRRIDGYHHKLGFHLSMLTSTNNKIISLRIRSKPTNDIGDVKYLWSKASKRPSTVLMDKGYDAEWLHQFFHAQGVRSVAPVRKGARRGFYRKKLRDCFPRKLYNKRSNGESMFHALKQKFGASVGSKLIGPARTELYCRAILHNIFLRIIPVLGQSPFRINLLVQSCHRKKSFVVGFFTVPICSK